jgi:hypothetical protein
MVNTPIKPSASSERQEVIDWLIAHNYPALPVAPAQSAWKHPKTIKAHPEQGVWSHCPLTTDRQPIPLYTGKNPSYLDSTGVPHLINHREYQNRLPHSSELEVWFKHPSNGVGTLGGWNNTTWLDFDVKQFPSQHECDAAVLKILLAAKLQQTFIERSHSGGWRIGVKVKQKPNFTNFSLTPGGAHVGEALYTGRFTVLAPTIGPSGNPYQSIQRTIPVEVESLESIGIYSTKRGLGQGGQGGQGRQGGNNKSSPLSSQSPDLIPGSIPLELLGNATSRGILRGECPTGDRSEALTTAIREWYGWQNWAHHNGILLGGDTTTLAHHAGALLGLDGDRIERILKTIDPQECHPAALYRGGEESCWQKIQRLDKATFDAVCPAHIKDAMRRSALERVPTDSSFSNGNGSGGGRRGGGCMGGADSNDSSGDNNRTRGSMAVKFPDKEPLDTAAIRNQIKNILIQDLPPSQLQTAKIRLRKDNPGISERELSRLFETIEQELELEESRSDRRSDVDNLLKLGDQTLNISEFLPANLAEPLKELAQNLNIRPEVCLTSLLVATSSLHKTQTELVIHKGQGFSVPPTIFAGLVSESGQKKSPILKAIIKKPMAVLQREKREAFAAALDRYEKDIADWDRCKSEERSSKFPEGKPKQPAQRLYYFTNSTGEGLLYQFQAHPDKALLALVDELAGLFASQNKYSGGRGSDRQDILSAFDGTGATVLRASGTKADIDGLLLSICGTIQPEILKRLMRDCSDPDGQWARFLFVNQPLAPATLADDNGGGVDLTERLLNYYRAIDGLTARQYRLSREAFQRYQPVYNQLERLRVSHPNPGMRAVYSKMEGYIGRLALNLHVLLELSKDKILPDEEIPLQPLESAIALAKFYIGQVKLIHANCAADLGDMAPHLAKVVELSKRMDATTGNSWIKAKVVQTGYDSRHRPRPDAIRSWFRELEALGIGSTRSSGIRLEYSWKLPDLPFDDSDTPPQQKVEKSGEKWITSPPPITTQNQAFREKVEKVDNPTHLNKDAPLFPTSLSIDNEGRQLVAGLGTDAINRPSTDWDLGISDTTPPISNHQVLITNPHSTYPLSSCDDAIPSSQTVDNHSTFPPPVDNHSTFPSAADNLSTRKKPVDNHSTFPSPVDNLSTAKKPVDNHSTFPSAADNLSTAPEPMDNYSTFPSAVDNHCTEADCEEPNRKIEHDETTQTTTNGKSNEKIQEHIVLRVSLEKQYQQPINSNAPAGVELEGKVARTLRNGVASFAVTVPSQNLDNSERVSVEELADKQRPTEYAHIHVTVEEVKLTPLTERQSAISNQLTANHRSALSSLATTDLGHHRCTSDTRTVAAERSEHLQASAVVPASVNSPGSLCTNTLPLLALVTALSIQGQRTVLVEWCFEQSPTPTEVAEPSATVEPPAIETDAEIDRLEVAVEALGDVSVAARSPVKLSYSVGDRVYWSNCPAHCEEFAPFEIMSIDGDYAKLDLFSKPVLLEELQPLQGGDGSSG